MKINCKSIRKWHFLLPSLQLWVVMQGYNPLPSLYRDGRGLYPCITTHSCNEGNAGVQSSAIIVQGLANNTLIKGETWNKFFKEISVAFLNGIVLAVIVFAYGYFTESLPLAITISVALMTVIIVASVLGTFIPLTLN